MLKVLYETIDATKELLLLRVNNQQIVNTM